jgi:hypothetical protein
VLKLYGFDLLQLGVAGGALLVMVILARGFFGQTRALMKHQEEQQEQTLMFFGNHIGDMVSAQAHTAEILRDLTNEIRAMRFELRAAGVISSRMDNE